MSNKVSYIIQLKNQFSKTAEKINVQFRSMERNARNTNRELKKQAEHWKGLRSQAKRFAMQGAAMTAAITLPLGVMAKSMIKAASDAQETANKYNAVFSDIAPIANKTAEEFAKKFSLAGSTARKMIGDTGDLLVGFKFASDQALDLSTSVTKLALDLDSFQNFSGGVEGASQAITKALLGETESMKSLGVSIQQNTKEFRAQVKATMRSEKVTERQAKALLILKQIQEQTKAATDDYTNTLNNSYAGSLRKNVQANIKFKESFGKLLLPIATKMVDVMSRLADKIANMSPQMRKLTLILAGLAAIAGPLLILFGGIAFAITAISLPVLAVVGAVGLLIAAGTSLYLNWEGVIGGLKALWSDAKNALVSFVNFGISMINSLLAPLNFVSEKLGFGSVNIQSIQAPSAPSGGGSGSFNGELTVKAEQGTTVKRGRSRNRGSANIGMNMVTQ